MKKLVCDRCGKELADKDDIDLAFDGKEAWAATARTHGANPRGILPCGNFVRCGGEMRVVIDNGFTRAYRWLSKLRRQ